MTSETAKRDYGLTGRDTKLAEEQGLANAQWYACPIPRQRLKELMQRRDGPAIRDTLIWFALLIITGYLGYLTWGTWWTVLPFAAYGVLYGVPAVVLGTYVVSRIRNRDATDKPTWRTGTEPALPEARVVEIAKPVAPPPAVAPPKYVSTPVGDKPSLLS